MIPIAFWPSLRPWLYDKKAAEPICSHRPVLLTDAGDLLRSSQNNKIMNKKPPKNPNKGESASASSTFKRTAVFRPLNPATALPAPTTPATREWLTLTGNPNRVAANTQITDAAIAEMTAY